MSTTIKAPQSTENQAPAAVQPTPRTLSDEGSQSLLNSYLTEYQKLKDEQIARIGFRDNLIYATLIAIGGILSYALGDASHIRAFLILPLATVVLGWTYLINDEKISAIGRYVRTHLSGCVAALSPELDSTVFGWERTFDTDRGRLQRKIVQLIVNESIFVGAGAVALIVYFMTVTTSSPLAIGVAVLESFFLIVLAIEIVIYAELRKKP